MTTTHRYSKEDLTTFKPKHDTFIGIDSDGCVFDTMEIKQKQCFHSVIISHWGLGPIAKYVRETAEFVNLYSKWRGQNRFLTLVKLFDLLRERPEVVKSGVNIPHLPALRRLMDSGAALGNPSLSKAAEETGDEEFISLLAWSNAVNKTIADTVKKVPPYKWC
ncbi:MAG: HAD family hydrolase, partial [Lentisphaerae bacterium]|nr:HAD family hydrolase [Lentisphaerota bacterium]